MRAFQLCFQIDENFAKDPGFVYYDFNKLEDVPQELHNTFAMIVVDPPFITREVWEKYAAAIKLLIREDGRVLLSTIDENEAMIKELTGCDRKAFRPSIPNLVYQYSFYSNYESEAINTKNPEIPDFE